MGLSQPSVANKLRLLNLDEEVQEALLAEKISERHARTLLGIADKDEQKEWLHRIINERLTVRQLDLELKKAKGGFTEDVPIVEANRSVADIRANAVDIGAKNRRISADDLLKPQEYVTHEVERLDLEVPIEEEQVEEDSYVSATVVPEFNIATPNSASTIVGEDEFVKNEVSNNTFFNFDSIETEEPEFPALPSIPIKDGSGL